MATLLLFKAGEQQQCTKICDFLNAFGHNSHKFNANGAPDSYYGINTETLKTCCGSMGYMQSQHPIVEKKIYDTIPTFIKLPIYIQKKLVENSTSKSPIPLIEDIFIDASKGGVDWNKVSSAEYYEIISAITANTGFKFKVIDTPLANTALADVCNKADVCDDSITIISRATNDCIISSHISDINEAVSDYINNKFSNDETELQNKEAVIRRDSGESKGGICCRKHKPRVTIKPLGYKEVIGRG